MHAKVLLAICFFTMINSVFRDHPQVREVDMLHVADYGNMDLSKLKSNLLQRKRKDISLRKSL